MMVMHPLRLAGKSLVGSSAERVDVEPGGKVLLGHRQEAVSVVAHGPIPLCEVSEETKYP